MLHADTDACFRLLQQSDFGFVHQILTYTRRHNESITSKVKRLETIHAEMVGCFLRYGPLVLDEEEFEVRRHEVVQGYYRMLARHAFQRNDANFWAYHRRNLAALGLPFEWQRLARPLFLESVDALLHIKHTVRKLATRHADDSRATLPASPDGRRRVAQGN